MREFILLKSAGLIALPKFITEKDYIKFMEYRWFIKNCYGCSW